MSSDFFTLCMKSRNKFPIPTSDKALNEFLISLNGSLPEKEILKSVNQILHKEWKRKGWKWSEYAAVLPDQDQKVEFDYGAVIISTYLPGANGDELTSIMYTEKDFHSNIIWY